MSTSEGAPTGYVVPSYRANDEPAWYHFLHGNVPGHQIDFMYRPEVPQGPLSRQHFSHLARLLKYIEPQEGCPYAFCVGNLSRDDTQHEPGHGGLALIFGLRIQGVTDHAGRQDPPFAHGIAAIDRELDRNEILAASGVFHRHVLAAAQSAEWYRRYTRSVTEAPADVAEVLAGYVAGFADLPEPASSSLDLRWTMAGAVPPPRVVIVHENDASFGTIAACAAKIAAVLYPSDIRWSAISNGREADVPNGVTVRLVAERNLVASDEARGAFRMNEVPDDPEEIARVLFGAALASAAKPVARGWRERYTNEPAGAFNPDAPSVDGQRSSWEGTAPGRSTSVPLRARDAPARQTPVALDAAATQVWDRSAAAAALGEIEVVVDDMGPEVARRTPSPREPGGSVRPPPSSTPPAPPSARSRAAVIDVDRDEPDSPPSLNTHRDRRETVQLTSAEAAQVVQPALPFRTSPKPSTVAAASAPTVPVAKATAAFSAEPELREPLPNFRRRSNAAAWKWLLTALALCVVMSVVLYVILGADSSQPTPEPNAPATALSVGLPEPIAPSVATLAPTTAPAPTAPSATATATTAPPPVPTAAPSVSAKASTKPIKPIKPKPITVFGGGLDLNK